MLQDITSSKKNPIQFLKKYGVRKNEICCPGPCINGKRTTPCGNFMICKETRDSKDGVIWRCRKSHSVVKENLKYNVKDVKLTVRHESWLIDCKLNLEYVVEMAYLWAQSFSVDEIMHELKLSKKTVVEWTHFFRESCFMTVMDSSEQIGGNGIEVEIDESKFGKHKYYTGYRVEGQWVFGGGEKYNKKKFLRCLYMTENKTLYYPLYPIGLNLEV